MRATVFSTGEAFVSGVGASGADKSFRINFSKGSEFLEIESGESVSLGRMIRSNSSYQVLKDATLPKVFTAMREYPLLAGVLENFPFAFKEELGKETQIQFFKEFEAALVIPHIYSELMKRFSQLCEESETPLIPTGSYDYEKLHALLKTSGLTASLQFLSECKAKGVI